MRPEDAGMIHQAGEHRVKDGKLIIKARAREDPDDVGSATGPRDTPPEAKARKARPRTPPARAKGETELPEDVLAPLDLARPTPIESTKKP